MSISFFSPTAELANHGFIAQVIWECLKNNDPEGVMEALRTFIEAHNKLQLCKIEHLAISTLHEALQPGANPTLITLCKLIHGALHIET